MKTKYHIQEEMYAFPYHHIPINGSNGFSLTRTLFWGYEYMSYIDFVVSLIAKKEPNSVLDVGCGDGRLILECKKKLPDETVLMGIDTARNAILLAKAMVSESNFIIGDITKDNLFSKPFDVITLIETFEHIPPEEAPSFLAGIKKYTHKDSKIYVTVPSINVSLNKKHFRHFSQESLTEALLPNFKAEECYFLNSNSFTEKIMRKLFSNRLFILNEKHLVNLLYYLYKSHLFMTTSQKCQRLCIIAKPI